MARRVVDVLMEGRDGTFILIVAFRTWSDDELPELQQKLNDYLVFALDGELALKYPDSVGRPVRIRIDLWHEPSAALAMFLQRAGDCIASEGVDFVVNVETARRPRE